MTHTLGWYRWKADCHARELAWLEELARRRALAWFPFGSWFEAENARLAAQACSATCAAFDRLVGAP